MRSRRDSAILAVVASVAVAAVWLTATGRADTLLQSLHALCFERGTCGSKGAPPGNDKTATETGRPGSDEEEEEAEVGSDEGGCACGEECECHADDHSQPATHGIGMSPCAADTTRDLEETGEDRMFDLNLDVARRVQMFANADDDDLEGDGAETAQDIPERVKVYVKTFGCSHNVSDSEFMMGLIKKAGFGLVPDWESADLCVLNSCTVKNPSQDGVVNMSAKLSAAGKKIVISGCVVQADNKIPQLKSVSAVGVKQIDKIVEAITETLKGNVYHDVSSRRQLPSLDLPKVRRNDLVEIIPLSTGCLGSCTYCKTKHARGQLGSYAPQAIVERVKSSITDGVQQIWLTSEDTGAYGIDLKTNIAELLALINEAIKSTPSQHHVMVRLGMTNPPYMLSHLESLSSILSSDHFFEFLHIPVQSGSNKVLSEMNREYTREEFERCVDELRKECPKIHLATDFICGFPDESDEDHKESISLLEKYKFPTLNISQFYPRPGTIAAARKRVPTQIVKSRSQDMTKVFMSYTTLEPWIGQIGEVWFSEMSDKSPHTVGHTKQYIKVLVDQDPSLIGSRRTCRFMGCSKWHLNAVLL